MTKRIILSLAMIALTIAGVTSATVAYFSDTVVLDGNTFSMGEVSIGETSSTLPLTFTNLVPTVKQTKDVAFRYSGTTPADIYIGFSDQNSKEPTLYDPEGSKSYMKARIYDKDIGDYILGWTDVGHFFGEWTRIATNISKGWKNYTVEVKLTSDAGNEFQGHTNTNNLIIYAIQHGGPKPTDPLPYQVISKDQMP